MESHYFDYAATTPLRPEAREALLAAMDRFGNPSSRHALGREAQLEVERCREVLAGALGCEPEEVYFTSGGTEGDNWALRWAAQRKKGHILTTAVEHAAVLEPVKALEQQGFSATYLPVDGTGRIDPAAFAGALRADTVMCSVMLVNNELGAVQPVEACVGLARAKNADIFFHTDGVQGFLQLPVRVRTLGVDALTLSGHKLGAPKGIGALYLRKGRRLRPLVLGGGQERGLRSGTESTLLISALAAAVAAGERDREERTARVAALRDYALGRLEEALPDLKALVRGEAPHILAVTLPGYKSEVLVRFLSDRGVYLSSGSACHKGKPSHVYAALGLPKAQTDGALRISFGAGTTREDVDALVKGLEEARATLFTTLS